MRQVRLPPSCASKSPCFPMPKLTRALARHAAPTTRRPQDSREGHRPRDHHDGNHIHVCRGTAPRCHQENPGYAAQHERRHLVPLGHQLHQSVSRAGACGHHHGAVRAAVQARGQARGDDNLARRPRRGRAQGCERCERGDTNIGCGGRHSEWRRVDGLKIKGGA